jgi:hypothetical protein
VREPRRAGATTFVLETVSDEHGQRPRELLVRQPEVEIVAVPETRRLEERARYGGSLEHREVDSGCGQDLHGFLKAPLVGLEAQLFPHQRRAQVRLQIRWDGFAVLGQIPIEEPSDAAIRLAGAQKRNGSPTAPSHSPRRAQRGPSRRQAREPGLLPRCGIAERVSASDRPSWRSPPVQVPTQALEHGGPAVRPGMPGDVPR